MINLKISINQTDVIDRTDAKTGAIYISLKITVYQINEKNINETNIIFFNTFKNQKSKICCHWSRNSK